MLHDTTESTATARIRPRSAFITRIPSLLITHGDKSSPYPLQEVWEG